MVIAGANPEAYIDNLAFEHGDGSVVQDETEAIISANEDLELFHAEDPKEDKTEDDDKTVAEVFETLNDTQKTVVYAMLAEALKNFRRSFRRINRRRRRRIKTNIYRREIQI